MWWTNIIIVSILIHSLLLTSIDGNANRRRRRRQTSGSLYGTNANLGSSAPAGYNYPASYNIKGIRLNNPDARDLYGNPIMTSSNTDNSLSSVNLYNQQRPQQQQVYGTNDQSLLNNLYGGNSLYSGSGTNQLLRDPYGNALPSGSAGSSFYSSSNTQMSYPPNTNQVLNNKDLYGTISNTNNNQYGYNSNQLPNSNSYGGPMGSNSNLLPNSNTYSGSMGNNPNLVPNSNTYSGYKGTVDNNNNNLWSNQNNYNPYGQNSANAWYPNRDTNNNNNNNNRYPNQNQYQNQIPYNYNNSYQLTTSIFIIFLSVLTTIVLH